MADGIYKAIKMPAAERHLRHEKHWRYISQHTVQYWTEARAACICLSLSPSNEHNVCDFSKCRALLPTSFTQATGITLSPASRSQLHVPPCVTWKCVPMI